MLLKYSNSIVAPASINKTLNDFTTDNCHKTKQHNAPYEETEESALVNFFRQVQKKPPPLTMKGMTGAVIWPGKKIINRSSLQEQYETTPVVTPGTLEQVSNELLSRLQTDFQQTNKAPELPMPRKQPPSFTYRSRAPITCYDLPPLAVND